MGLTRIRAEQISDIDYKQAVRVITLTDITLSGGAPAEVDGVSLVAGDRVLVNGQSNAAENGLYQVQTVGAGSNGTWVRTSDANADGEIQPGMVVMVTQGNQYADTPWKLTTNGEIIIGTTELTFAENYSLAFGNIVANGTAILANTVSGPVSFAAGDNIAITGNNTSKTVTIGVTGISLNSISNGTSNVSVVSSGGNVTVGVADSTIATFYTDGLEVSGTISGNGTALSGINAFGNIVVAGESTVAAGNTSDTLTFAEGSGISIVTDAANNIITIGSVATDSIFATGGDMGLVTEAVTVSEDLGLITDAATVEYDLGLIVTSGVIQPDSLILPTKTVAELANLSANPAAQFVYCSDESGGAVPAFSDGTNWRRVTDRAVVT
jgi:hypothetical protein